MDKSKLLENLLKALEMMPDEMSEKPEGEMPEMKEGKGIEIMKVKALGKPEMEMSEEDCEEPMEDVLPEQLKKKKLFS